LTDDQMKKTGIYLIIIGAALCFVGAAISFLKGGSGKEGQDMGPESVVESFCRLMAAGRIDQAKVLCDTAAMQTYLDTYMARWEELQQKDSTVLGIASEILSGSSFSVINVDKTEDGKAVTYSLEAYGEKKTRKATVRKEEGEWKVTDITDVK